MTPDEVRFLAVVLARWPAGVEGWLLHPTWEEIAFQQRNGIAQLVVRLKPEPARLSPILRLALARCPQLTDADIDATRHDVAQYLQACLSDDSYSPRDLAVAIQANPHALAVLMIRGLRKGL